MRAAILWLIAFAAAVAIGKWSWDSYIDIRLDLQSGGTLILNGATYRCYEVKLDRVPPALWCEQEEQGR
jgi:beta-lactamase class A